ncbi:hypothetical protein B0H10DRAFT_2237924 [Mycena sp. CBHHK59/15]|nr:hypothetical protein B0H10DRAFT_2237924 [Mycena sp. CBHHK59/15]
MPISLTFLPFPLISSAQFILSVTVALTCDSVVHLYLLSAFHSSVPCLTAVDPAVSRRRDVTLRQLCWRPPSTCPLPPPISLSTILVTLFGPRSHGHVPTTWFQLCSALYL